LPSQDGSDENAGVRFVSPVAVVFLALAVAAAGARPRVIIETDAGGDPDDEQSLVRLLVCANDLEIEGIIANRPAARDGENLNPERTGIGIVRRMVQAYAKCWPWLVQHDANYPKPDVLLARTVQGTNDREEAVRLVVDAVDRNDPRPVWFLNWGTDKDSGVSNLKRALDLVRKERGAEGYEKFKRRLRLSSDDKFGEHTTSIDPPFPLWVDTFPPRDGWEALVLASSLRSPRRPGDSISSAMCGRATARSGRFTRQTRIRDRRKAIRERFCTCCRSVSVIPSSRRGDHGPVDTRRILHTPENRIFTRRAPTHGMERRIGTIRSRALRRRSRTTSELGWNGAYNRGVERIIRRKSRDRISEGNRW
jgi:hypothetical protein